MKHLAEKVFKLLSENYLSPLLVYQEEHRGNCNAMWNSDVGKDRQFDCFEFHLWRSNASHLRLHKSHRENSN